MEELSLIKMSSPKLRSAPLTGSTGISADVGNCAHAFDVECDVMFNINVLHL